MNDECPFFRKISLKQTKTKSNRMYFKGKPQCFSLNDTTRAPTGEEIPIGSLKIGEKVLAMDKNDQIISTEVIAILHYEQKSKGKLFFSSIDDSNELFVFF
mgnify:FL=1